MRTQQAHNKTNIKEEKQQIIIFSELYMQPNIEPSDVFLSFVGGQIALLVRSVTPKRRRKHS